MNFLEPFKICARGTEPLASPTVRLCVFPLIFFFFKHTVFQTYKSTSIPKTVHRNRLQAPRWKFDRLLRSSSLPLAFWARTSGRVTYFSAITSGSGTRCEILKDWWDNFSIFCYRRTRPSNNRHAEYEYCNITGLLHTSCVYREPGNRLAAVNNNGISAISRTSSLHAPSTIIVIFIIITILVSVCGALFRYFLYCWCPWSYDPPPPIPRCRANSTVIRIECICDIDKGTRYVPKLSKNVYWKKKKL